MSNLIIICVLRCTQHLPCRIMITKYSSDANLYLMFCFDTRADLFPMTSYYGGYGGGYGGYGRRRYGGGYGGCECP